MDSRSLLQAALRGENEGRPPIWLMRQAGRYMAEYRQLRERHSFMELCHEPDLATEITLQPIRAFGMDAAIFFCDILVTAEALGCHLDIVEKKGPVISNPIRSRADFEGLLPPEAALERLAYTATALKQIRSALPVDKGLLGFAGAPLTVASYMIEGGSSASIPKVFRMIQHEPELFTSLMERLTDLTVAYVKQQMDTGVDAVQIFESWASLLPPPIYRKAVLPHLRRLVQECNQNGTPLILFALAGENLWGSLKDLPVRALSLGPGINLGGFRTFAPEKVLQGNLDSRFLLCDEKTLLKAASSVLDEMKGQKGYIFNLGHGITPPTPEDRVRALVECVQSRDEG